MLDPDRRSKRHRSQRLSRVGREFCRIDGRIRAGAKRQRYRARYPGDFGLRVRTPDGFNESTTTAKARDGFHDAGGRIFLCQFAPGERGVSTRRSDKGFGARPGRTTDEREDFLMMTKPGASAFPVSKNVSEMKASSTLAAMQAADAMRHARID